MGGAQAAADAVAVAGSALQAQQVAVAAAMPVLNSGHGCIDPSVEVDSGSFAPGATVRVAVSCHVKSLGSSHPRLPGGGNRRCSTGGSNRSLPVRPAMTARESRGLVAKQPRGMRCGDDNGSFTVFIAVLALALFSLIGLVIDGGRAVAAQTTATGEAEQAARLGADRISGSGRPFGDGGDRPCGCPAVSRCVPTRRWYGRHCHCHRSNGERSHSVVGAHGRARNHRGSAHRNLCFGQRDQLSRCHTGRLMNIEEVHAIRLRQIASRLVADNWIGWFRRRSSPLIDDDPCHTTPQRYSALGGSSWSNPSVLTGRFSDGATSELIWSIAWMAWAWLIVCIGVEVVGRARGRAAGQCQQADTSSGW